MSESTKYPETPELDKQSEIIKSGKAAVVQEFIDWLRDEKKYELASWVTEATEPCPGIRRDPFDPSNCEDGVVIKTRTRFTYPPDTDVQAGETCPKCEGTGEITVTYSNPPLVPEFINPQQLMADFFGIELNKIEAERRSILEHLRSQS